MFRLRRKKKHAEQPPDDPEASDAEQAGHKESAEKADQTREELQHKLAEIAITPFRPRTDHSIEGSLLGLHALCPGPIAPGLHYKLERGSTDLYILEMDLGDPELEGKGIGALIIAAALQDGLRKRPELATVSRSSGNLPFVKTLSKVVGIDKMNFRVDGEAYGDGEGQPPAESAWEGRTVEDFSARDIRAVIGAGRLARIDIPAHLRQLSETGHTGLGKPSSVSL